MIFNGKSSLQKALPGGGPQGTIIALFLFLILINELGLKEQSNNVGETITKVKRPKTQEAIHLKYVDDFSLAESINLKTQLMMNSSSQKPESYHNRTGHMLPCMNSLIHKQLLETKKYADNHLMKLNLNKTKLILFNPSTTIDFQPEFLIEDQQLELVEEIRLLGLIVRSDLKWISNTKNMVRKANQRLWMIKRLKNLGAMQIDLVDVFVKQIRSVVEFGVPVWHSSITHMERNEIERVQKSFCKILLGDKYVSYSQSLSILKLETLETRRKNSSLRFALKAEKHDKFYVKDTKLGLTVQLRVTEVRSNNK